MKIIDDEEQIKIKFDLMDSFEKMEKELNKNVKLTPFQGMEFKETKLEKQSFDNSIYLNPDFMMPQLMNAATKSPQEVEMIIGKNIDLVINNIVLSYNDIDYFPIFRISSVLIAMKSIFSNIKNIPSDTITGVNHLIMKAFREQTDWSDNNPLMTLYRGLAVEVNRDKYNEILGINSRGHSQFPISQRSAIYICLSRYSAFDRSLITNVKRLNYCIASADNAENIYNEQILVDIYQILFDVLFPLVVGTILDTEFIRDEEEVPEIYSLQVNAVLAMLNHCSYNVIWNVLKNYCDIFFTEYGGNMSNARASFRALSPADYPNIVSVVNMMNQKGIFVP